MKERITFSLNDALNGLKEFIENENNINSIEKASIIMSSALKNKNQIISCGNGGSMCDAMHFAEELTGRFRNDRPAYAAQSISDPSHITCTANDYGFDKIFSRYVEAFGKENDVLVAISTSGNSLNIINACEAALKKKMKIVALSGKTGGKLNELAHINIIAPGDTSDRIQEIHIKIIHILIETIEYELLKGE